MNTHLDALTSDPASLWNYLKPPRCDADSQRDDLSGLHPDLDTLRNDLEILRLSWDGLRGGSGAL